MNHYFIPLFFFINTYIFFNIIKDLYLNIFFLNLKDVKIKNKNFEFIFNSFFFGF